MKWGTGRLSYDPAAAERVRQVLAGRSDVVEKKMVVAGRKDALFWPALGDLNTSDGTGPVPVVSTSPWPSLAPA
jgi:hypothetical protein